MSVTEVSSKSKKRRGSGKKSQKISFDEEIVPKSIAQKFNVKPEKGEEKFDLGKKSKNKMKKEIVDMETSESPQPKKQKRKKKLSQSQNVIEETENMDVKEESFEELHDDTELDPSNPVVKTEVSKRALQRQKHQRMLLEKKVKVDLILQQKSLNYLSRWKHNQSEWKFEKLRQVWLQQNMFDCDRFPEKFWTTLVEYFSGAKGQIRKTILDEALTIIKQTEQEDNHEVKEDEDEVKEDEDKSNKVQRARDIIQSLQE